MSSNFADDENRKCLNQNHFYFEIQTKSFLLLFVSQTDDVKSIHEVLIYQLPLTEILE